MLYMTNTQENKLHLIKSRFKQMCLKTLLKALIDLQSLIDPGRAFHSLRAAMVMYVLCVYVNGCMMMYLWSNDDRLCLRRAVTVTK